MSLRYQTHQAQVWSFITALHRQLAHCRKLFQFAWFTLTPKVGNFIATALRDGFYFSDSDRQNIRASVQNLIDTGEYNTVSWCLVLMCSISGPPWRGYRGDGADLAIWLRALLRATMHRMRKCRRLLHYELLISYIHTYIYSPFYN